MWAVYVSIFVLFLMGVFAMAKLSELVAVVSELKGTAVSVLALIDGLVQKVEECDYDPATVAQLIADVRETRDELAFAVEANSPVPPPVDPVEPDPVDPTDPVEDDEEDA